MIRFVFALLLICLSPLASHADVYRPAYLELQQTDAETYQVVWKLPALDGTRRSNLKVQFPEDVKVILPARTSILAGAYIERSTIRRSGGLAHATIAIKGLEQASTDVLVRIQHLDGSSETTRLNAGLTSYEVKGEAEFWTVLKTYMVFGIEHILAGMDHLLFVACLMFIAGSWHRILVTITGFTIAHSITLTLSALEIVVLPVPPIEAVIALSIVFLAREIALDRRDTLTWRYPIAISASFGLLHGFGFASALKDIGLPQTEIPTALLAFNAGVEIGQIMFVVAMLIVFWLLSKMVAMLKIGSASWLKAIEKPMAYTVGGITMFWTIERISGF
jgi:hydrogenase/urease accessory protein HupE